MLSFLTATVMAAEGRDQVRVGVSRTPAALPLLRLVDSGVLDDTVDFHLDFWVGPEQLVAMVQGGRHDLFTLPLTVAATLIARGVDLQLTNVNTWGGIALVTADPDLRHWTDLAGATLYLPQRTSPPEVMTRYFLAAAGLQPGTDLTLLHAANPEMAQLLRAGRIENAVLLEPQVTAAIMAMPALRVAFRYDEEWRRLHGPAAAIPTLGFGGRGEFLTGRPDLITRIEEEYRRAVDWTLAHPAAAGQLAERYLGLRAAVVADAVPHLGLRYVAAKEAAPLVQAWFREVTRFEPEGAGDGIPDAAFY